MTARYDIKAGRTATERCGLVIDRNNESGEWLRWDNLTPEQQRYLSGATPLADATAEELLGRASEGEESEAAG